MSAVGLACELDCGPHGHCDLIASASQAVTVCVCEDGWISTVDFGYDQLEGNNTTLCSQNVLAIQILASSSY